jgi:hypothetical protein
MAVSRIGWDRVAVSRIVVWLRVVAASWVVMASDGCVEDSDGTICFKDSGVGVAASWIVVASDGCFEDDGFCFEDSGSFAVSSDGRFEDSGCYCA